ncbi:MAG: hypothetical protein ABIA91_00015 [Patescibacteria group bacterium]
MYNKNSKNLENNLLPPGLEEIEIEGPDNIEIEAQPQIEAPRKISFFWNEFKGLFLFFVILEFVIVLFGLFEFFEFLAQDILPGLILIFEFLILIGLSARFVKIKDIKNSFFVPMSFGILVGFVSGFIKIFQYLETWVIYNIFLETIAMIIWAVIIALVVNAVNIIAGKIDKIIRYRKNKVRSDLKIN